MCFSNLAPQPSTRREKDNKNNAENQTESAAERSRSAKPLGIGCRFSAARRNFCRFEARVFRFFRFWA